MLVCKECHVTFRDSFEQKYHIAGHRQRREAESEMLREICRADLATMGDTAKDEWARFAIEHFQMLGGVEDPASAFRALGPMEKRLLHDYLIETGLMASTEDARMALATKRNQESAEERFGSQDLTAALKTCRVCGFQDCLCLEVPVNGQWAKVQREAAEGLRFLNRMDRILEETRLEFKAPDAPIKERKSGPAVTVKAAKPEPSWREKPKPEPLDFEAPKRSRPSL